MCRNINIVVYNFECVIKHANKILLKEKTHLCLPLRMYKKVDRTNLVKI